MQTVRIAEGLARRTFVLPWLPEPPVGGGRRRGRWWSVTKSLDLAPDSPLIARLSPLACFTFYSFFGPSGKV